MLTSYIGFRKQALPYAPLNRMGVATVRPKREAVNLARALIFDNTTHPLRLVTWTGVGLAIVNLAVVLLGGADGMQNAAAFLVLALMLATIGEYVGGLTQRLRDRPAYYVREEHTSSVLLREERRNVVGVTSE
jgi:hypothetical protein